MLPLREGDMIHGMGSAAKPGKKILVVDDNETIVISITKVLEKEGYKTDFAYDGMTAIKKALYNNYGLILLDITLPDMDGFQVCTELKKNQATRFTPIIFISTLDDDKIYDKGFELGIMDYLKKPLPSAELIFRIKNYLRLAETENKLRQSELLFRSIVNDQTEFVIRYKPDGTLTFVNTAFSLYVRKNTQDLLGANFFDLLRIDKNAGIRSIVTGSGLPVHTDVIEVTRPGGGKAWHQWIQRAIIDRASHKVVIQSIGRDITENKIAEDNMRRWEHIFNNAAFGILVTRADSIHFEQMNRAYAEMHGYTVEELKGRKISSVFSKGTDKQVKEIIDRALKDGHYSFQATHVKKNGEEFAASIDLTMMKDEEGRNTMLLSIVQDISESVAASNALLESEERFRTIFMNSPDTMAIVRLSDLSVVDANDKFFEMTGYSREEVIEKPDVIPGFFNNPKDLDRLIKMSKEDNKISNLEVSLLSKKGHEYPTLVSASRISLKGKLHIVVIIRNIEEIKKYQESLKASETKFRLLADYNYNWEFWLGPDQKYIYVSPSCENITGYKAEEFMKSPTLMRKVIHPDYVKKFFEHASGENWEKEKEVSLELQIIDKNGNIKWLLHNCNPVYDHNGNFLGRRGSNMDITHRKNSEKELLTLSTAIEQSRSYIVISDTEGVVEYVNPYFLEMTGYPAEEVLGRNLFNAVPEAGFVKSASRIQEEVARGNIWQGEILYRKSNNEALTMYLIITPIKDEHDKVVNYIAVGQDITKQKEIDRQILQTIIATEEKERSRFAQDLHDDLGPLLSTAKLYIRSFETATDAKNKDIAVNMSMKAIDEAIMSIKEIANNISPHVLRNFGLFSGIQSFISKINEINTLRISFNSNTEVRFDASTESSVFRIVSELVNNTIKHASAGKATITFNLEGETLYLIYTDDGIGFDLEKALEKHLARGMTNIINRVKSLGGDISFGEGQNKGFSARVAIPVAGHLSGK